jgi:hypothetical protein
MDVDAQKFFIGLMDVFSILLPGALLTYLLMGEVGPIVLGDRYTQLAGAQAWAAFLFASYLFGHLVFLLGSWLDEFYGWARGYKLNTQIALLAPRGRLLAWTARSLVWLVFNGKRNLAVDRAAKIKQQALGALQAKDAINTFQWSKVWLNAESPASLAVVQSFEAGSALEEGDQARRSIYPCSGTAIGHGWQPIPPTETHAGRAAKGSCNESLGNSEPSVP